MNIDPVAQRFSDVFEATPEQEERFAEMCKEGKIVARADSVAALKKLQDDLRKAGYRRQR